MKERAVQDLVEKALTAAGIEFERECRLSGRDRVDFKIGSVAIELKKGAAGLTELRQITRYLEHPEVTGCVLVALRCRDIPPSILGKPIACVELWRFVL